MCSLRYTKGIEGVVDAIPPRRPVYGLGRRNLFYPTLTVPESGSIPKACVSRRLWSTQLGVVMKTLVVLLSLVPLVLVVWVVRT